MKKAIYPVLVAAFVSIMPGSAFSKFDEVKLYSGKFLFVEYTTVGRWVEYGTELSVDENVGTHEAHQIILHVSDRPGMKAEVFVFDASCTPSLDALEIIRRGDGVALKPGAKPVQYTATCSNEPGDPDTFSTNVSGRVSVSYMPASDTGVDLALTVDRHVNSQYHSKAAESKSSDVIIDTDIVRIQFDDLHGIVEGPRKCRIIDAVYANTKIGTIHHVSIDKTISSIRSYNKTLLRQLRCEEVMDLFQRPVVSAPPVDNRMPATGSPTD